MFTKQIQSINCSVFRETYLLTCLKLRLIRPIHLYLIFEKSSLKNQVRRKSILKLIFAGYTGSKNPVRNRLKIQFFELDFSTLIFEKSSTDG